MRYVIDLEHLDRSDVDAVGGKAAHLGELSRIDGIRVPAGFCVSTDAFAAVLDAVPAIVQARDRLSRLGPARARGATVRRAPPGRHGSPDPR